ncbi:MAG TPA: AGE family epimerase/isomerase [Gammaproteobacteria bacterium]|nr:AGE family epimerase/isomerase [Gammaproteobacteria bacterium]
MTDSPTPNFRDPRFLADHVRRTFAFYHPRCIDPEGGFFQFFRDDGSIYDERTRHLVSSTRFVFNYCLGVTLLGDPGHRDQVRHGLAFLRERHRNPRTGGYAWILDGNTVADATNHCYGHAFVLLAYACALEAGVEEAGPWLEEAWELLETHFYRPQDGLYRDELSPDWKRDTGYRGQNANMHTCEAMLAAWRATGESRYLDRADTLARGVAGRLADMAGGRIWEHYHQDWSPDWEYNRAHPDDLFRPWGFQPGHQIEWSKLLLTLHRERPDPWLVSRARALFDYGLRVGWDDDNAGLVYGVDPQDVPCNSDKYFWVQAEAIAACARLAVETDEDEFWVWYQRLWEYAWAHFVDHRHGAWFRILSPTNARYDDLKSPAGKTDYHTMGACAEVIHLLAAQSG